MSGRVLPEIKLAETPRMVKLVGTFSVGMKPISLSPGHICNAAIYLYFLSVSFHQHNIQELHFQSI